MSQGNRVLRGVCLLILLSITCAEAQDLAELTGPVNDFAGVIDDSSEEALDGLIRSLQRASGDVVVVVTIDTFAPYADLREYAVRLFENRGRGIGQRGRDNGLLVVLAAKDRQVWVEVGYDLEQFITDGFAGETSRQYMAPEFRRGNYGAGLLAGVSRIVTRIAERRNVSLQGGPREASRPEPTVEFPGPFVIAIVIVFVVLNALASRRRGRRSHRRWGAPIGGWHSGVGPFGGGFGGFGRGGGFGGGFGGFGGGRSGGGGGGAGW